MNDTITTTNGRKFKVIARHTMQDMRDEGRPNVADLYESYGMVAQITAEPFSGKGRRTYLIDEYEKVGQKIFVIRLAI